MGRGPGTASMEGEEGCEGPKSRGLCSSVVVILSATVSSYTWVMLEVVMMDNVAVLWKDLGGGVKRTQPAWVVMWNCASIGEAAGDESEWEAMKSDAEL